MPSRTPASDALYDPTLTYEENLQQGPFGGFTNPTPYANQGQPTHDFFGTLVYSPFGIAAGPLPGARFVKAAFDKGFDVVTFKSVRTGTYPCHPAPNIMPVELAELDAAKTDEPITAKTAYDFPLSAANSYGIPSFEPEIWQPEIKKALTAAGRGQALLVAFQGTDWGKGAEAFIEDHVRGIRLLRETGAEVIEINLSCPNEGSAGLLCFDTAATRQILERIRDDVGSNVRLLVKVTYFADSSQFREFVEQTAPLVDGYTAINTVGARVITPDGQQAFPGDAARAKPGISGPAIKHLALEMVEQLNRYRQELSLDYRIIGVGGVQSAEDFQEYREAGADTVMSVTGAMWSADLAAEIKENLAKNPAAAG